MNTKFVKKIFIPQNPSKYKGRNPILARSLWEYKFMNFLDKTDSIIEWASEPFPIVYFNPIKHKVCRYYPDFIIRYKGSDGNEHTELIEIKPYKQTIPPVNTGKKRKSTLLIENATYIINKQKWEAAKKYCEQRQIIFRIMTEKELNIK